MRTSCGRGQDSRIRRRGPRGASVMPMTQGPPLPHFYRPLAMLCPASPPPLLSSVTKEAAFPSPLARPPVRGTEHSLSPKPARLPPTACTYPLCQGDRPWPVRTLVVLVRCHRWPVRQRCRRCSSGGRRWRSGGRRRRHCRRPRDGWVLGGRSPPHRCPRRRERGGRGEHSSRDQADGAGSRHCEAMRRGRRRGRQQCRAQGRGQGKGRRATCNSARGLGRGAEGGREGRGSVPATETTRVGSTTREEQEASGARRVRSGPLRSVRTTKRALPDMQRRRGLLWQQHGSYARPSDKQHWNHRLSDLCGALWQWDGCGTRRPRAHSLPVRPDRGSCATAAPFPTARPVPAATPTTSNGPTPRGSAAH